MNGFFGWVSSVPSGGEIDVVRAMSAVDSTDNLVTGTSWAFGIDKRIPDIHADKLDDDSFSVVCGNIYPETELMTSLVDEHGQAAACALRYRRDGTDFLSEISGSFSVVVRANSERMLLAQDRAGICPVFYSSDGGGMAFSSHLSPVIRCPQISTEIDPQAIYEYLYFHMIPGPKTVFSNIRRLVPGSFLEFDGRNATVDRYWNVSYENEFADPDIPNLEVELKRLLRRSVEREISNESNVGCFLSGGIDSSSLTGLVGEVTGSSPRTYSIGFDQQGFDEMEYARIAARRFNADHHEYYVTPDDIVELVPGIGQVYSEPFGNSSVIPTYYCAKMAREDGVTKLLGGDGGDEMFGGNERYATQLLFSYYFNIPSMLRSSILEPIIKGFPFGEKIFPFRKARRYIEQARIPMPDRLQTYNYFNMIGRDAILHPDFASRLNLEGPIEMLRRDYQNTDARHVLNRMLALDLKFILADNDLRKVNGMCQFANVRVGYPFMHDSIIQFASKLPADLKVRNLRLRYFFKRAMAGYLPDQILKKKKHGFGLPFGDWVRNNSRLQQLAYDSLDGLKSRGIVRPGLIDSLREDRLGEHANYYGGMVWILMILEQWLSFYDDVGRERV